MAVPRSDATDELVQRITRAAANSPLPALDVLERKQRTHTLGKRLASWLVQPDKEQTVMRAWGVLAGVGEVQVLRDQESVGRLGGVPHYAVVDVLPVDAFLAELPA